MTENLDALLDFGEEAAKNARALWKAATVLPPNFEELWQQLLTVCTEAELAIPPQRGEEEAWIANADAWITANRLQSFARDLRELYEKEGLMGTYFLLKVRKAIDNHEAQK
jgi:hypothetical protein